MADRVKACEEFLERAQRRCVQAEADLQKAIGKRDQFKSELEEGQRRLAQLQAEVANPPPLPPQRSELEAEVQRLREELSKFTNEIHTKERPRVRQKVGSGFIHPMPGLVPGELHVWLEDRQSVLQEALELGEAARVLELSSKISEGAVRLFEMGGGVVP